MQLTLFDTISAVQKQISKRKFDELALEGKSPEERVKLLILRDLKELGWNIKYGEKKIEVLPPEYDKETIKQAMSVKREELINANRQWIDKKIEFARKNLASGYDVMCSEIDPIIEVCETQKQIDLFRIFR